MRTADENEVFFVVEISPNSAGVQARTITSFIDTGRWRRGGEGEGGFINSNKKALRFIDDDKKD